MPSYQRSYYSETLSGSLTPDTFASVPEVDVCIVGGGIAALSCAQTLIQGGRRVAVVEANKVFSGASGLNGGFVAPGYALSMDAVEARVGLESAKRMFDITVAGVERIRANIRDFDIQGVHKVDGKIRLLRYAPTRHDRQHVEDMRTKYDYDIAPVDIGWLRDTLSSTSYHFGYLFRNGFQMHPLNYGVAMYRQLQSRGLHVLEGERVTGIRSSGQGYRVTLASGEITARDVVLCTGGYTSTESSRLHGSIFPITTYVGVTEADDSIPERHIKTPYGLGDTRRASDYYRIVNRNQLLWGGRITAFPSRNLTQITEFIRHDIQASYPLLKTLRIKIAWSGIMGYAMHKMPYLGRMQNGVWYCTAFGGHGLGPGTGCGDTIAKAILGQGDDHELFRAFPMRRTFGILGRIGVEATYKKYILMDHIRESTRYE